MRKSKGMFKPKPPRTNPGYSVSVRDAPPTMKQLYVVAQILRASPGLPVPPFPRTRGETSDLIDHLKRVR
jgi:hypothetical protein